MRDIVLTRPHNDEREMNTLDLRLKRFKLGSFALLPFFSRLDEWLVSQGD